jgi:hypothetical protein
MSHFGISGGKGFHMSFANGWCISVQFGWGNYCENKEGGEYGDDSQTRDRKLGKAGSSDAEVAVFDAKGEMVKLPAFMFGDPEYIDIVSGWNSSDKVLELMNWTASQPKEPK